jgi:hypothetical protein
MRQTLKRILILCMATVVSGCSTQDSAIDSTKTGQVMSNVSAQSNWPTDIPLYPQSKIRFSEETGGPEEKSVILFSEDTRENIKNYYPSELILRGWTVTSSVVVRDSLIIVSEKDGHTLVMTIRGEDGSVTVSLGLRKKL